MPAKNRKKYVSSKARKLFAVLAALLVCSTAGAAVSLAPDSELFVFGNLGVRSNDNVFLSSSNATSATILDFNPGVLVSFGQGSDFTGKISFDEDFTEYSGNSDLNSDLAHIDFSSKFDDGATKVLISAWYHEVNQATRDVRNNQFLVLRDLTHVEAKGENSLSEKTSLGAGFVYDGTDYKRAGYVNWQWYQVPVNYYYRLAPGLDVSGGIAYQDNSLGTGGINSNEYFYNLGVRGDIAPKLKGEFAIGYDQEQLSGRGTVSQVGLLGDFRYSYDEKTDLVFGVHNKFGYSAGGQAFKDTGFNAGFSSNVSAAIKLGAQFSYSRFNYSTTNQADDFYTGGVNATYAINKWVSLTAAYTYADDNSNLSGASFKNNILSLTASFRY